MPSFRSFDAYNREVDRASRDLEREARGRIAMDMAKAAQGIATRAASNDLGGDPKFSGWAPILDTQVKNIRDGAILTPTRSSAGPWTVAEFGRNQGGTTGFLGPGINRKTGLTSRTKSGGLRKVRSFKAKRWNGYTQGKHTASEAQAIMERDLPKIAERESRKVLQRHFDVT